MRQCYITILLGCLLTVVSVCTLGTLHGMHALSTAKVGLAGRQGAFSCNMFQTCVMCECALVWGFRICARSSASLRTMIHTHHHCANWQSHFFPDHLRKARSAQISPLPQMERLRLADRAHALSLLARSLNAKAQCLHLQRSSNCFLPQLQSLLMLSLHHIGLLGRPEASSQTSWTGQRCETGSQAGLTTGSSSSSMGTARPP